MLNSTPTPASLTPIFARMPYSVMPATFRVPPLTVWMCQAAASSSCQSQHWPPVVRVPLWTSVEHSPARGAPASARISVRALSAAIVQNSTPAPSATPAISSTGSGAHALVASTVRRERGNVEGQAAARGDGLEELRVDAPRAGDLVAGPAAAFVVAFPWAVPGDPEDRTAAHAPVLAASTVRSLRISRA